MTLDDYLPILETGRPERVERTQRALDQAGIPYRTGLLASSASPRVLVSVPRDRAREAWDLLSPEDRIGSPARGGRAAFPWSPVIGLSAVLVLHLLIVLGNRLAGANEWLRLGGIVRGLGLEQPWRLLTAMFLHVDPPHALWNGVSMTVFGVPLLSELGTLRTALIYLAAGFGGGVAALQFLEPGRLVVGSSGAVAGLFGAWLVTALGRTRYADLVRRARFRVLGIAMLFLPALLSPVTSTGRPVSVSSHVGGLITGMLIGAAISFRFSRRSDPFAVGGD